MEREDWHAEVLSLAEEMKCNGVDPAALLREGLALAKILAAVREKDTPPPPDTHPLLRRVYVPAVAPEDTDPVLLLAQARDMVQKDERPLFALKLVHSGYLSYVRYDFSSMEKDGPRPCGVEASVAANPGALFYPEIMALLLRLEELACRPLISFVNVQGTSTPVIDSHLRPLPEEWREHVDQLADRFLEDTEDPVGKHWDLLRNLRQPSGPDPDDVPLGAPLVTSETQPSTPDEERGLEEMAVLLCKHAALVALRRLGAALQRWSPSREIMSLAFEMTATTLPPTMKRSVRNRILAQAFGVSERMLRRKLEKDSGQSDVRGGSEERTQKDPPK